MGRKQEWSPSIVRPAVPLSLERLLGRPKTVALRPTILMVTGYLVREVSPEKPTSVAGICEKTELSQDAVQRVLRFLKKEELIISMTLKDPSPPRMLVAPAPWLVEQTSQNVDLQNEIALQNLQVATNMSRAHILQQALAAWNVQPKPNSTEQGVS